MSRAIVAMIVLMGNLAVQGSPELAELLRKAQSNDQQTRVEALEAIGERGSKAAPVIREVCRLLTAKVVREDPLTLSAAVVAIADIGIDGAACIPELQRVVRDRHVSSDGQGAAQMSIWKIRLHDPNPDVRIRAAEQLGGSSPSVIPALRKALQDSDPRVRKAAEDAIRFLEALSKPRGG